MVNPYSVTSKSSLDVGYFGDKSSRRAGGFLYRVIEVVEPLRFEFLYSGWWFRQQIRIDDVPVWSQISWLWIKNKANFRLPSSCDPAESACRIEIDFSRGLRIRRFRLWVAEELVYDEVTP
ncbi:MAG: hypothetical protein AAF745_04175 [Planctomycetota bacterium]